MRTAGLLLAIACMACNAICTSNGDRRCEGTALQECHDGDWIQRQCLDAGVPTTCHATADGGAEC